MVKFDQGRLKNFIWLIPAFLAIECANQQPPQGGEVDTTPPKVTDVFPSDGTTNFSDDYFELGFSEYVDKRSVKEAIFISPALDGELELDWSGKYVRVFFPHELKQNITYVVTIGTDVLDYNNKNKMAEAFSFTFSTGPEIDRRVISGKVFDEKPQSIMLFGYLIKESELNPLEVKPDYISQTNVDGKYRLAGLAAGKYRIFAVRDEFRDLLFQPEQDQIGIPFQDIELGIDDTLYTGMDFILTQIDTVKPRLLSATMTDRNHILLNFSEEISRECVKPINFYLYDSTSGIRAQIVYAFKGNTKPAEIVLVPKIIFPIENEVWLFMDTLKDKSNNYFFFDFAQITLSDKVDTAKVELFGTDPAQGSKDVDFINPIFVFNFNDGFDFLKAQEGFTFTDTAQKKIAFTVNFNDDASFVISPLKKLEASKDYIIKIDFSKLKDFAGNFSDTVYQFQFKTISGLEFTGVSGKLVGLRNEMNAKIELRNTEKNSLKYAQSIKPNGQFNFERILPGKYLLFAYYDEDSSNTFSVGNLNPFIKSEEFAMHPDTLNLRARWIETDVKFNIGR